MKISSLNNYNLNAYPFKKRAKEPENNNPQKKNILKHIKRGAILTTAAYIALTAGNVKPQKNITLSQIEQNAKEIQLNLKFEKADLVYDINDILDEKKLSEESLKLYMRNVANEDSKIFMSENAGQMMDVLAIAATSSGEAKEQVKAEELTPLLLRALQYDKTGLFDETNDKVTGDGEPWYYIAAAMIAKEYPDLIEYMPEEEKQRLKDKGFIEGFWEDIQYTFGGEDTTNYYLGDTLKQRDFDYAYSILANDTNLPNLPSDNPWFGPACVGYAIRGKLDNVSDMTLSEIEDFRLDYALIRDNQYRFAQDEEYREQVISSYIIKYMVEAIEHNSGKVNSGLASLGLQYAGLLDEKLCEKIMAQLNEEVSAFHLINGETKKLDVALKAFALAKEGAYDEIPVETRIAIRKFQANNPSSTATSVFMLAEETYLRQIKGYIDTYTTTQNQLAQEISKNSEEQNLDEIVELSTSLQSQGNFLLSFIENETKVAQEAKDEENYEKFNNLMNDIKTQNSQLEKILGDITIYNQELLSQENN